MRKFVFVCWVYDMALHISRFTYKINPSFLTSRLPFSLHARIAKPALAQATAQDVTDVSLPLRRVEEIAIWARGIPHKEVLLLRSSIQRSQVAAWSTYEKEMMVLCEQRKSAETTPPSDNTGRPSPSQLEAIHVNLADHLPKLFVQPLDYKIFHANLVFENNIRGTRTVGIFQFVKQIAILRAAGHWKFAYVKLDVLKMTSHPEDGSVRVRWRIRGISMLKVVLALWKYKLWNIREALQDLEAWHDGFSTFYVGADGLVYKHIVDKMTPDEDRTVDRPKTPLGAKVALMWGLAEGKGAFADCLYASYTN